MTRGTKGKVVKKWSGFVYDATGEGVGSKVDVRLSTGDGLFRMELPKHILDFFGHENPLEDGRGDDRGYSRHQGDVSAKTLEGVEGRFVQVMQTYKARIRDQARRKVIVVEYRANHPRLHRMGGVAVGSGLTGVIGSMSFAPAPALGLKYRLAWDVNGKLYTTSHTDDDGTVNLTFLSNRPSADTKGERTTFVLDWTEEREAFFAHMVASMTTLMERIAEMLLGDVMANVDRMIAGGGLLSLPAPAVTLEDGR